MKDIKKYGWLLYCIGYVLFLNLGCAGIALLHSRNVLSEEKALLAFAVFTAIMSPLYFFIKELSNTPAPVTYLALSFAVQSALGIVGYFLLTDNYNSWKYLSYHLMHRTILLFMGGVLVLDLLTLTYVRIRNRKK